LPATAKDSVVPPGQAAEVPLQAQHRYLVLDRVGQAHVELVPDAEGLVEPAVGRPRMPGHVPRRVGQVHAGTVRGEPLEHGGGRRQQLLDRGREVQPGAGLDPLAAGHDPRGVPVHALILGVMR
jgi:hypothetical protein